MDTRDTPEQAELRRTARRLARELGPRSVASLDDEPRRTRLAAAVGAAGWLELRGSESPALLPSDVSTPLASGASSPLASGVEAAIVAEALAEAVADVPFAGPVLAADLERRAGAPAVGTAVVAFAADLIDAALVRGPATSSALHAVDSAPSGPLRAYVLTPEREGFRLAQLEVDPPESTSADLTRAIRTIPAGTPLRPVPGQTRLLGRADLDAWSALGLALTSADLVGLMRGVLALSVAYAKERKQYGVAIGSFQAVQHLLAEAHCLLEGAFSASLYPAWGVDALDAAEALEAGRVAKAYAARAARTVCETAIQVYGGMGNTWDCPVHLYLRRALLSSQWFGDAGAQLRHLERSRLGVVHGLS